MRLGKAYEILVAKPTGAEGRWIDTVDTARGCHEKGVKWVWNWDVPNAILCRQLWKDVEKVLSTNQNSVAGETDEETESLSMHTASTFPPQVK